MKQTGKWKDHLLKSSLPLQQLVSEKLEKHELYVTGEYTYSRSNERDVETEFSVDLRAFNLLKRRKRHWGNLNVLIECKYNHPGVRWIFSQHPKESDVTAGCISCLEDLCTERLENKHPLYKIDNELRFCTHGVELYEQGVDPNAISHGLSQLRYALPNLVADECRMQVSILNEEDLSICFICPILVTTASLYILKFGLSLQAFQCASSLNDVAEEVDALVVHQAPGPQLLTYCHQIVRTIHLQHPEVKQRLEEIRAVSKPAEWQTVLPPTWHFNHYFTYITENILVVRFEALDQLLKKVHNSVLEAGKSAKRVAALSTDLKKRVAHVVPIAPKGKL